MRRTLGILAMLFAAVTIVKAQGKQDFASKFMERCEDDTAVHCITVSPKMMEQLTKQADASRNERMVQAIEKLKSARIVTSSVHGEGYYHVAEDLLKRNAKRFSHDKSYRMEHAYGSFYSRKAKDGGTVELILLHADTKSRRLVIVNLTGDIDDEFMESLTKMVGERTPKT